MNNDSSIHGRKMLRARMRSQRRQLSSFEQSRAAASVLTQLQTFLRYRLARRVAFYFAADGEIDPDPLLNHALECGKSCYLPVLKPFNQKQLHFVRYQPGLPLKKNRYGIEEPVILSSSIAALKTLDIIFMPLVAFDRQGHRLGMGGGYYDRTLSALRTNTKPLRIGLAHSFQEVDRLPDAPWDIPLDYIATEHEFITALP